MSVQSEMDRIRSNVQSALGVIADTGVEVPAGANSDALPDAARALANAKQDKLTGTAGQVVGFDAQGNAVAQPAPQSGMTQAEADGRYVKRVGGTIESNLEIIADEGVDLDILFMEDVETLGNISIDTTRKGIAISGVLDPINNDDAANKGYVDAQRPKQQLITLTTSAWANHLPGDAEVVPDGQTYRYQAVSVPGILADESKQLIQPMPTMDAQELYISHGVRCMQQKENQLIFYCDTVPVDDLSVYIVWQEVRTA